MGERIKRLIKEGGTSAGAIHNKNQGYPNRQTINNIENDKTKSPGLHTLQVIAHELGLTVSQLIGEAEVPKEKVRTTPDEEIRKALHAHLDLSREEADFFWRLVMLVVKEQRSV